MKNSPHTHLTIHFGILIALVGCAAVQPSSSTATATEILTPSASFRMLLPPFVHADVNAGAHVPVVGTTTRDGKTYRVVSLPDPAATALRFLVTDDGHFEGSAINAFNGSKMGWSYKPEPDVTLVALDESPPIQPSGDENLLTIPPNDGAPPIARLWGCITPFQSSLLPQHAELFMLGVMAEGPKIISAQHAMSACNDERVKAAVQSAGSNQDLRGAVKAFYVKQQTLIDAYLPHGEQSKVTFRQALTKAQSDRDESWSAVQLEMKLSDSK